MNVLAAVACISLLWQERDRAINDARIESVNVVRLLERDVRSKLHMVASNLDSIGGRLERTTVLPDSLGLILTEAMKYELQRMPYVQRIAAFNSEGQQICRPAPPECPNINVRDRHFFQHYRQNPASKPMLFGPLESRLDGQLAMIFARGLVDLRGSFFGVVISVIPVQVLAESIQGVELGAQGAISMRTLDLALLARRPELPGGTSAFVSDTVSPTLVDSVRQSPESGTYSAITANDAINRQTAYKRVRDYPLYVIHGQAIDDYLHSWNRFAIAVAAMLVMMAFISVGVYRYFRIGLRRDATIRRLYDTAPCGYLTLNASGVITNINETELQSLGEQRADVVGRKRLADFLTSTSQVAFESALERLKVVDRVDGIELDQLGADGSQRRLLVNADSVRAADGTWLMGHVVLFDISELHLTRQRLSQLAQKQSVMLNTDLIAIVKLRDRKVVWANKGCDRIFGYSGAEWNSLPTRTLHVDEVTYAREGALSYAAMNAGDTYTTQVQMRRKDGSKVWIDARGVALAGEANTYLMLWSDISATREAEERRLEALALSAQNAHLAEEGRLKQVLLSNMAHELRTPLNGVIGFSQLITMSAGPQGLTQIADHAAKIEQSGFRLLQIIDAMLDYAELDAGRLQIDLKSLSPTEVVQDVRQMLLPEVRRREVTVEVDLEGAPTIVQTDPVRLRQIVLQLLDNAVKFSHQKGKVTVRVAAAQNANFRIDVSDQGVGIALEDRERIWSTLTQLSTGSTKSHGGTGLGLALVSKLVKALGGTVSMTSEKGVGSTFSVFLPIHPT